MANVFIHQILNHYTKKEDLDPGFLVLDNSSNQRPDWFEYWPIRHFFLLHPALEEESFYGFVSPKFKAKTNIGSALARRFIDQNSTADVILLSPSIHLTAHYLNVFVFGETMHPGLLNAADEFFRRMGRPTDLNDLVTTSRNEVYSNYMIGKPRFWKAWLEVTEKLYAIAEDPQDPLGEQLRKPTLYRGGNNVQMKIFIMERVATWLLAQPDSQLVACVRDPFVARSRRYKLPGAITCDALKIAYLETRREGYKDLFQLVSRSGRIFAWLIRIGAFLRYTPVTACMSALSSYWKRTDES
jgi:hypothetical protein